MFPEYRYRITHLKATNAHFQRLFNEHNDLDQVIKHMESGIERATLAEIEELKKRKLKLKDQIYTVLCDASPVSRE